MAARAIIPARPASAVTALRRRPSRYAFHSGAAGPGVSNMGWRSPSEYLREFRRRRRPGARPPPARADPPRSAANARPPAPPPPHAQRPTAALPRRLLTTPGPARARGRPVRSARLRPWSGPAGSPASTPRPLRPPNTTQPAGASGRELLHERAMSGKVAPHPPTGRAGLRAPRRASCPSAGRRRGGWGGGGGRCLRVSSGV